MHNMRASLEIDLMREHPIHLVAAWLGHTPDVAIGNYLQTLPHDFEKARTAARTPRQGDAESSTVGAVNG